VRRGVTGVGGVLGGLAIALLIAAVLLIAYGNQVASGG
jgi:hypothetical protein